MYWDCVTCSTGYGWEVKGRYVCMYIEAAESISSVSGGLLVGSNGGSKSIVTLLRCLMAQLQKECRQLFNYLVRVLWWLRELSQGLMVYCLVVQLQSIVILKTISYHNFVPKN